jgi:hypothetical protein
MPRTSTCPPDVIYEALKSFKFVDEKGNLLAWGDNIWEDAASALEGKMSKDYIYLYLSKNRNGVFNRIHNITSNSPDTSIHDEHNNSEASRCSPNDLNWSIEKTLCSLPSLRESFVIPKAEWDCLKCQIVHYKDRSYNVLAEGWADVIYDIIWSHMKLPCPFSFKHAKINRNPGEIYLSIRGSCSECDSKIHIYCPSAPADDDQLTVHVSTFDSRGIAHNKKRQVRGVKRLRIGKELQGKSTYAWRREEARKVMSFGDVVPASLPTEEVARKAKQEVRDKELGLFKVRSVLASLWDLKYGQEFSGSIHEIGLDKFYVMYWTKTQLFLWKKFLKGDDVGSVSIDATGNLVKQIQNPEDSKRVIFLYQAVCGYHKKILPLFQMISEKHDTNTLTYWMREWLRSGGTFPRQVVTDYSLALLNAVSLAFNNKEGSPTMLVKYPRCIIRIDIAHLIKLVTRWKCLQNESLKKDFFVRCVGLMSTLTDVEDVIKTCTDVMTVARATHEDIDDKKSHCFAASTRLVNRLKHLNLCQDIGDCSNNADDTYLPELGNSEASLRSNGVIASIIKKIDTRSLRAENLKQGRLNPYHCPDFGSRLLKLCKHFVLWTAVLTRGPKCTLQDIVATSARSEEYFRELKTLVFNKGKTLRVDKFLVTHLRSLEGTSNLLNAPEKEENNVSPFDNTTVTEESTDLVYDSRRSKDSSAEGKALCLNEQENWRGLNKTEEINGKTKEGKKRGTYLTACPDIEIIHKRPKFITNLPLLANGNILKPMKVTNKIINIRNTCAFDATMQSILAACHDYDSYAEYLSTKLNPSVGQFLQTLSKTGVTAKLYETRGSILIATQSIQNDTLDCTVNISHLLQNYILNGVPSIEKVIKCLTCGFEVTKCVPLLYINPILINQRGMAGLQEAVNATATLRSSTTCFQCKSEDIIKTMSAGRHLILDIEDAGNEALCTRSGHPDCQMQFALDEIPDQLFYEGLTYKFVSAIIYSANHYFAIIRRVTGKWEEHNDLKAKVMPVSPRTLRQQHSLHVLLYVQIQSNPVSQVASTSSPEY